MKTDADLFAPANPVRDTLDYLCGLYPCTYLALAGLYERQQSLVAVETILYIATGQGVTLWGAEEEFVSWWAENRAEDCPGELWRVNHEYGCYGLISQGGIIAGGAPMGKRFVGRSVESVRVWLRETGGSLERVRGD